MVFCDLALSMRCCTLALFGWLFGYGDRPSWYSEHSECGVYLGHLAYEVFKDSFFFPFALALFGLSLILLTVWISAAS